MRRGLRPARRDAHDPLIERRRSRFWISQDRRDANLRKPAALTRPLDIGQTLGGLSCLFQNIAQLTLSDGIRSIDKWLEIFGDGPRYRCRADLQTLFGPWTARC